MAGLNKNKYLLCLVCIGMFPLAGGAIAADLTLGSPDMSLGKVATTITGSFTSLAKLITAGSYLAGLAFAVGAILKFKQHKDNPTQIPIGTPIAMVVIAAALLFLPTILGIAGGTLFGGGTTAGPTGTVFSKGS